MTLSPKARKSVEAAFLDYLRRTRPGISWRIVSPRERAEQTAKQKRP